MPKNRELQVRLKLKDEMSKRLSTARARLQRFSTSIKQMGAAFKRMGIVATAALAAVAYAIKRIVSSGIAYGLQLDKISKQTAMTAEEFAKLSYAAKQEHGSIESLTKIMPILAKYMEYAREGMATYKREFDKMGISVTNASGDLKSTYKVLLEMAEYYKTAENKTQALAIAATLLGRRGAELIPVLRLGKEGIKALGKEAENLGIVLSGEAVTSMKKYDDQITRIKTAWQGVKNQITIFLLPALGNVAEMITKDFKAIVAWAGELKNNKKAVEEIKEEFVKGYKAAQDFIYFLIVGTGQVIDAFNDLKLILNSLTLGFLKIKRFVNAPQGWGIEGITAGLKESRAELKLLDNEIAEFEKENVRLATEALKDYSTKATDALTKIKKALRSVKQDGQGYRDPFTPQLPVVPAKDVNKNLETIKSQTKQAFNYMEQISIQSARNMQNAFSNFFFKVFTREIVKMKDIFNEFGRSVLHMISNLIAKWVTMQIITGVAKAWSGFTAPDPTGSYNVGYGSGSYPGRYKNLAFHTGGPVRAHQGYLASDEVPAILQAGEGVLSRRGMTALGRLNSGQETSGREAITVNITVYADDEKSFRDKLAQYPDIYQKATADSIERNGFLRGIIDKYKKS